MSKDTELRPGFRVYQDIHSDFNRFAREVIALAFVPIAFVRLTWNGIHASMQAS